MLSMHSKLFAHGLASNDTSWYHQAISEHKLLCAFQSIFRAAVGGNPEQYGLIGFKEIRYKHKSQLDLLQAVFPCARFVISSRKDVQKLKASRTVAWADIDSLDKMRSWNSELEAWAEAQGDLVFQIHLEDFSLGRFNRLLRWLGVAGCTFSQVARENGDHGYSMEMSKVPIQGNCKFLELRPLSVSWLHIPKAGTSFANTLITWGCSDLPATAAVDSRYENSNGEYIPGFMNANPQCSGLNLCAGHDAIRDGYANGRCSQAWESHKGQFVAMFRQPAERTFSGFRHNRHDVSNKSLDLGEYASAVEGCSVKMINGRACGDPQPVTNSMVYKAMSRIDEGFAFVGLTEEWELSVCLFHRMFGGGPVLQRELVNIRPAEINCQGNCIAINNSLSDLGNWTDRFDGPLYKHASTRFWQDIEAFDVTRESCMKLIQSA